MSAHYASVPHDFADSRHPCRRTVVPLQPYVPPAPQPAGTREAQLEGEVAELKTKVAELEAQLAAAGKK